MATMRPWLDAANEPPGRMAIVLGVHVEQKRRSSAICVGERHQRETSGRIAYHFTIRHLTSLSPGMSYPAIADRVGEVVDGVRRRTGCGVTGFINVTGLGEPIIDVVRSRVKATTLTPVFFNHGDQRHVESGKVNLGKAYLVARLQMLLQDGRIHLPRSPETERLATELKEYEIQVAPDANERYGAFKVGSSDHLVTALGLAVQVDESLGRAVCVRIAAWG